MRAIILILSLVCDLHQNSVKNFAILILITPQNFRPPYFSPYPKLTPTAFDRANAHTSLVPCVSDTRRRANAVRAAAATTSLVRCAWGGRLPDDAAQSADIRILNHHFIWTDFRTTLIFDPL